MAAFKLSILSPQGKAFEGDCDSLVAPGYSGEFGVLAGHAPMIAMLKRGIARIIVAGETSWYVTGEGVCEVSKDAVSVLVDTATKTESLDAAKKELAAHLTTVGHKP